MNNLQKYLLNEAIKAINAAGGNLIKDGELDITTIAASMNELLTYIRNAENEIQSKVEFKYAIMSYENRKEYSETFNRKPIFALSRKEAAK